MTPKPSQGIKRKHEDMSEDRGKMGAKKISYHDRRLVLKNVPLSTTKPQIFELIKDFEEVSLYMP
jgi:RNA recognition motif-containing protein